MRGKKFLISAMLLVSLFAAIMIIRHIPGSKSANVFKDVVTYNDVDSSNTINVGDTIKIGNENFYVLYNEPDGEGDNDVWLFAKYNLDFSTESNIHQKASLTGALNSSNTTKFSATAPRVLTSDEVEGTWIYEIDTSNPAMSYYFEKYRKKLKDTLRPESVVGVELRVQPIEKFELTNFGCRFKDHCTGDPTPAFMWSTNYWTGSGSKTTSNGKSQAYAVLQNQEVEKYTYDSKIGIRPLITIKLSDLLKEPIHVRFHNNLNSVSLPSGGSGPTAAQTTEPATQTHYVGDTADSVPNAVANGYRFNGWFPRQTGGSPWDFDNVLTGDLDLYAQWSPLFTLTYVPGDCGTMTSTTETVALYDLINKPSFTEADDKIFVGWYSDPELTNEWIFNYNTIQDNTTLYAKCEDLTGLFHHAYFDMNGHALDRQVPDQRVNDGAKVIEPEDPYDDGWRFTGWMVDDDNDNEPFDFTQQVFEDKYIIATWVPEVRLTFDMQGHGEDDKPEDQVVGVGGYLYEPDEPGDPDVEFIMWGTTPSCEEEYNFAKRLYQNEVAYACWEGAEPFVRTYEIVYDMNGHGTQVPTEDEIPDGGKATKPADPTEEGWTFHGWFIDDDTFQNEYDFNTEMHEDKLVHAKWTENQPPQPTNTYKIVYDMNDHGTQVPTEEGIEDGDTATQPADPTAEGWTFHGWFLDDDTFENEYDFDTAMHADVEVHAKWTENPAPVTYKIEYDMNDHGTQVPTEDGIADGGKATKPADPTEEGWTFHGWFTDDDTFLNEYDFNTEMHEDKLVHAKWTQNQPPQPAETYKIVYDMNDHGTQVPTEEGIEDGGKATKPADPTEEGWTFHGWFLDDNTFENEYDFNTEMHADVEVHAKWTENPTPVTYKIEYDMNEHGTQVPTEEGIADGGKATKPTDPTEEGWTFHGWFLDDDTFENEYDFNTEMHEDKLVHAKWTQNQTPEPGKVTVTFHIGEHGGENPPQQILDPGEKATDPNTQDDGYWTFGGWYLDEGLTQPYNFDNQVTRNIDLWAEWIPIKYTVDFVMHGHGEQVPDQSVDPGQKATDPNTPNDGDYVFGGWYRDEGYRIPYDFDTPVNSDITLHAKWIPPKYRVDFEIGDDHGPDPDPQEVDPGNKATDPNTPDETCWKFIGWYLEPEFLNEFDFNTEINRNYTLYAKWVKKTVKVTFDMQGHGTAPAEQTISCGGTPERPATDPVAESPRFEFINWFVDPTTDPLYPFDQPVNEDTIIYARWDQLKVVVQYDTNGHGDETPDDEELDPNSLATEPRNPNDEEYVFEGWYLDPELTIKWDFDTDNVTEDIILYAKWTRVGAPQTYDNIVMYVVLSFISLAGLSGAIVYKKRHNM